MQIRSFGGKGVLTLSLVCFSASLASLWLRRSSRLCCCSLKPFCFCRASVIHKGPVSLSFSWTLELSSECLLWSDGFSAAKHKKPLRSDHLPCFKAKYVTFELADLSG